MPTYDYKCGACGHQFEHFQSMKDAPLRKCPKCAKARLERLIGTGAAIIFKGSGFYQTDYRNESYKKAAEADKPLAEAKPQAKPDSKPDTAPAAAQSGKPPADAPKPAASPGADGATTKPRKSRAKA
ncbi:MAG: zinc ribbon domain-containing protein [Leptolyngbya sp. PLA1]|nr:zinc ribbon domain-containing protein [Leptolyngbya sp. PLA1]